VTATRCRGGTAGFPFERVSLMSFWEGISGQIYNWNQVKIETKAENLKELRAYIAGKIREHGDEARPTFTRIGRLIYTFYGSEECVINRLLDTDLNHLRKSFFALNSQQFRYLICVFCIDHIFVKLWIDQTHSDYWTEMARLACIMSGIKGVSADHYLENWSQCYVGLADTGDEALGYLGARLTHKVYEHIAPILGLPNDDRNVIMSSFFWRPIATYFADTTSRLLELPEWQADLDKILPLQGNVRNH
jgi:hypothetical protein